MPITMSDWIKHIQAHGWTLHITGGNTRWYIHESLHVSLKVCTNSENFIECEVSAFLPTTFINVSSPMYVVTQLDRIDYTMLLARRISHACNQYANGAP